MTVTEPAPATTRAPQLRDQTVVLIGGSAGIGLETARLARAEGADVILVARDADRLASAAREVGARSTAAFDAAEPDRLERFFADLPGRSTRTCGSRCEWRARPSARSAPGGRSSSWAAPAAGTPRSVSSVR
jgi:NAD(P)-dependent dehydrogenase (short-subunit alcohol dehydrogenase family)